LITTPTPSCKPFHVHFQKSSIASCTPKSNWDTCCQKTKALNSWTKRCKCHSKPNANWVHNHWPSCVPNGAWSNVVQILNHVSDHRKCKFDT
jgi:hypothetical protein